MLFTVVTWNVLATAYIRANFYPRTPARCLDPAWRRPAVVARARALDADVLCLQEVEVELFAALRAALAVEGYVGDHALKDGKPDGCAVFVRASRFRIAETHRVAYRDDAAPSGHIAQLVLLDGLAILNTHLKWDPPGTPTDRQWGMRQTREALELLARAAPDRGQIVCGDLNVTPDSDVIATWRAAGFEDTHRGCAVHTCNSNGVAKLIDYVLVRGVRCANARTPRAIDAQTALPSEDEPSDHLPLEATLELVD